jgi:mono/diheme cytochrome c family protein
MKAATIIAAAAFAALGAPAAGAAGDATAGHALAVRWCTSCHVVDDKGTGSDAAPPFRAIARAHAGDRKWLHAWLSAPHPSMPNFDLARQQIDDIVAYLDSLRPR